MAGGPGRHGLRAGWWCGGWPGEHARRWLSGHAVGHGWSLRRRVRVRVAARSRAADRVRGGADTRRGSQHAGQRPGDPRKGARRALSARWGGLMGVFAQPSWLPLAGAAGRTSKAEKDGGLKPVSRRGAAGRPEARPRPGRGGSPAQPHAGQGWRSSQTPARSGRGAVGGWPAPGRRAR